MVPKIQMTVSREGVETINIQATNDREERAGEKLLEEIRPLIELMDRLLEKKAVHDTKDKLALG